MTPPRGGPKVWFADWNPAEGYLALIGLLPVAAMFKETLIADGRFSLDAYRALLASGGHLVLLMGHSLQLAFLTASLSTLIGVPLGVLLGKTDLPWRSALTLVFAAPLLIPSYVLGRRLVLHRGADRAPRRRFAGYVVAGDRLGILRALRLHVGACLRLHADRNASDDRLPAQRQPASWRMPEGSSAGGQACCSE